MKFNKKFSKLDYYIVWGILFVITMILSFYFEYRRHDKLKHTENTEAVLTGMGGGVHYGTYVKVDYFAQGEKLNSRLHCNCPELNVGDTILIRYSLKDPSTIALVKKFYMKKYRTKSQ